MYANEETIQAIIDETLLRIPDKEEHKQFWKNTCIDITNFENKSIENLEPGAYIHYGALDSVYDLFPFKSFNVKRNPETVAILTSCEMFVLEIDRRYKQLEYQVSGDDYIQFTDFAGTLYVYNATDIDGDTGNFIKQFNFLWHSSSIKNTIPWYNQNVFFQEYVDNEYISTTFGYDSIVHKKGSDEYVYSFPEETGTIALLEDIPTKLSDLTNDSGYITIGSVGNGTLTITQNGTSKGTFSANQSSNNTVDITVPTKTSDLTNDSGYITIGSVGNGTLTIQKNGTTVQTFSANQSSNSTANITVPTKLSDLTNDTGYITIGSVGNGTLTITQNGTSKGTFSANQSGNSTVDITVPTKTSDLTNDSGYTTNIGTVTQVKVGSTAYNPSSGIVSLPAYPTTLPASDVYSWAKASAKPSYTASEVGALPLSGGTMTGTINTPPNAVAINFRGGITQYQYQTTVSQQTAGDEALVFASKYALTSFIFVNDEDSITNHDFDRWQSLTPGLQIKNNKVAIGKLIADGVTPTYALDVNGTVNATSFEGSGANLTGVVHTETDPTVPSWAKASAKPSYTASEVGALPLSGGTMTGTINTPENNVAINFRPNNTSYYTTISYQNAGEEALVLATKMLITSFIFVNGEDSITNNAPNRWMALTPGLQIKNNKVAIGKLIANGVTPTYALDVNGTVNATSFEGNGASLTGVNADTLQNSAPDEGTGASTIVKRTSTGQVKAVYYNMSGEEDNINSFTSHVAFVSSEGWIRKTSKANFSTWLLTWTKLGSTTGNTQLSYTGTYTEFFVILDLGFYAETFYFVASALGAGRHFFGGTTNTADGSSWVLYARRSNSTYYFEVDRVHQDGTDYTSQVNVSVYAR